MHRMTVFAVAACLWALTSLCQAQTVLTCKAVDQEPVIDGKAADAVWKDAPAIEVRDSIAEIDIRLQAVYTTERLFFLVQFADPQTSQPLYGAGDVGPLLVLEFEPEP